MITIGFVILSHRAPEPLLRLVRTLNTLYGDPPIVCHHDFSQAPLAVEPFPANVRFVRPSYPTGWGKWAVVDATLAALALLYADDGPDWFTLLSAADYPLRSREGVLATLSATPHDAFLDARPLENGTSAARLQGPLNPQLGHFDATGNRRVKWGHYKGAELWIPIVRRTPRLRVGRYTIRLPFAARGPFVSGFECFYGDHWFTANRKAARILIDPTPQHRKLRRYLRMRTCVDECYYQSVLCNSAKLSICLNNQRYAEWNGGGAHPMDLTADQLPAAFASGAWFGRKFTPGAAVLDAIDERLGLKKNGPK